MNFFNEMEKRIEEQGKNEGLKNSAQNFMTESIKSQYSYNFTWMGRPVIQYPQDMMAMQELIWQVKPDLIIETGIARGGSLVFYASMLELIGGPGRVLGIDIDIREHNRKQIESHKMFKRIEMIEGSSVDPLTIEKVKKHSRDKKSIMAVLDSNHTHEHVYKELQLYSEFVTTGSYLVVFDSIVEYLPDDCVFDRPWSRGNNPMTAVDKWIMENKNFETDRRIDNKLLVSVAPKGYLKKIR
jgi:cephalosporin hydroxylase